MKKDNNDVLQTRLCIKNLPNHISENELKTFLSSENSDIEMITDIKVMESSHMAFLGVRTSQAASALIQSFHRSYCQTKRISVEYAKRKRNSAAYQDDDSRTKQKKTVQTKEKKKASETKQQSTAKTKFWANDDAAVENVEAHTTTTTTTTTIEA